MLSLAVGTPAFGASITATGEQADRLLTFMMFIAVLLLIAWIGL